MAQVGKNVLTRGLSGKLGNLVVFRRNREKTIMSVAPGKRTHPLTEAQQRHLQQFREAVVYAKSVLADQEKKAEYKAAAKNGESAFNVAVADYLKLPVIKEVDLCLYAGQVGDRIRIRAIDNFKVVNVSVGIYNADNTILETGIAAGNGNGLDWFYTAIQKNPVMTGGRVVVTVTDSPGHQGQMAQML
jgi:hypothetical protein